MQTKRYHIIVDVENCELSAIGKEVVEKILIELPPLIDMHVLYGPVVVDGIEENPGVSGFVIIDYSHISIHTFTKYGDFMTGGLEFMTGGLEFMIDIFSCKPYEKQTVIEYLAKVLHKSNQDLKVKVVGWE